MCAGWTQDKSDTFDWTLRSGSTPSSNTGPSSGHGGSGNYMYIETSSPRKDGDIAKLKFTGSGGGAFCLRFFYHMYGKSVKILNVYSGSSRVFTQSSSQGNKWIEAKVPVSASSGRVEVTFEGIRGSSWQGDIAIDDVTIEKESCSSPSTSAPPTHPPPSAGNCGSRPSVRIVGGTEAPKNSWPWQVMILTKSNRQFCGGSLIDPLWVVTAAHCFSRSSPTSVKIRLGAHYRVSGSVGTEQDINVAQIISHENYKKPKPFSNDVALLKLAKPAVLSRGVGLVCLSNPSNILPINNKKKHCWISGWGTLASGGSQPNALMQASVPLVSKLRCLDAYPGKIDDSMLCAGLDQGGVDTCQGDSGGPLVCEFNGRWFLEGAISWGYGCARPNKFGVYASIANLRSWIINKAGFSPPSPSPLPTLTAAPSPQVTTPTAQPPLPPDCNDDHKYADICPSIASCGNFGNKNKVWSQKNCQKSCRMCQGQLPCGFTSITQSRVIGGQDAKPGAWPWQIALERRNNFICGGSLISATWIITAAHCVAGSGNPADYKVVVGDHNQNANEGTEETVSAKRIISYPEYNRPGRLNNDIALVELAAPVKLSARVNPVCLPPSDSDVPTGSKCYITGWGKIKHPGSSHPILQQPMMPPIDPAKCRQRIQASGVVSITLTPQMLCAGVDKTILSSCHGDSGGPFVCLNADGKTYTLHGPVSWGSSSCNAKQLFTVFARVTQYRAWIKQHTGLGG